MFMGGACSFPRAERARRAGREEMETESIEDLVAYLNANFYKFPRN
jgi:hypothetical protein